MDYSMRDEIANSYVLVKIFKYEMCIESGGLTNVEKEDLKRLWII